MLGTHQKPDITRFAGVITGVSFEEATGLYGEWFLYDGETLHFGQPQSGAEVTLQYARHIESLHMDLSAAAMTPGHIG